MQSCIIKFHHWGLIMELIRIRAERVGTAEELELYGKQKLTDSELAHRILKTYFYGQDREEVVCLCLDTKGKITAINSVSVGTLNQSFIHPREIFKGAILSNCASIIIAHNHPSGDPSPSPEDRIMTDKIKNAGQLMGIPLLDSLILGEDQQYYSFADHHEL